MKTTLMFAAVVRAPSLLSLASEESRQRSSFWPIHNWHTERQRDRRIAHEAELSDSDEEDEGRRFDDVGFEEEDDDEEEE